MDTFTYFLFVLSLYGAGASIIDTTVRADKWNELEQLKEYESQLLSELSSSTYNMDSPDKRGDTFRFGKRGDPFRFGKRGDSFRFGKRGNAFRFGKRAELKDDLMSLIFDDKFEGPEPSAYSNGESLFENYKRSFDIGQQLDEAVKRGDSFRFGKK